MNTNLIYIPSREFPLPFVVQKSVLNHLKSLKLTTISRPDNIPNCILKNYAESLSTPLIYLKNLAYFPEFWNSSFILPLHKSGSKNDVGNYSCIAKLSSIPKLLEKILPRNYCFRFPKLYPSINMVF